MNASRKPVSLSGKDLLSLGNELQALLFTKNNQLYLKARDYKDTRYGDPDPLNPIYRALTEGLEELVAVIDEIEVGRIIEAFERADEHAGLAEVSPLIDGLSNAGQAIYDLMIRGYVAVQLKLEDGHCFPVFSSLDYLESELEAESFS